MNLSELLKLRRPDAEPEAPKAVAKAGAVVPAKAAPPAVPDAARRRSTPAPLPVAQMPEEARRKAAERLRFVQLVRQCVRDERVGARQACEIVARRCLDAFPLLAEGGKHGVSALQYNNYRNWAPLVVPSRPQAETLRLLADGYSRGRRQPKGPAQFWKYLAAAWLSTRRLPMTVAYDVAVKRLRLDGTELVPPSFHQAKYYLKGIDKQLVVLAREGEVAHRNSCIDFIDRDWEAILPGDMIVGDSRTFDTRCRVWDEGKGAWIAVRPTVCALMDAASCYFAAWTITPDAVNAWEITNALAIYCATNPPPLRAYFDNGRDYTARGFSTPVEAGGRGFSIFNSLGIQMTNSIAYNARAKTVERMFTEMMQQFDKTMPDYLGSSPAGRTMDAAWYDAHPDLLPSLHEFTEAFVAWLVEWHSRTRTGALLKGRAPADVWAERRRDGVLPPDQLREAFSRPVGTRQVVRGPAVNVAGRRYVCDALKVGDEVLVRLDHVDPEVVHCCALDGAAIGLAHTREAIPAIARTDEDRRQLAELLERQRHQRREALTALSDLTGRLHLVSPYELIAAGPDAELRKIGAVGSVKGLEHHYDKHVLEPAGADPVPRPALPVEGDAVRAARPRRQAEETPDDPILVDLVNQARHDMPEDGGDGRPPLVREAVGDEEDEEEEGQTIDLRGVAADEDDE